MQVAVVGHGEAFEECEEGDEVADEAGAFAADEFCGIRIFLLRHEAGACGEGIADLDEAKFCTRPEDEVFCEA